jgi:arabinogalactan endo-1,4-beta-galactosidase
VTNNNKDWKKILTFRTKTRWVSLSFGIALGLLWNTACGGGSSGSNSPPPTISPPTIAKAFGAASVALNATTTLTFNLSNPNSATSLSGIGFTDTFPSGLTVSTPNGLTGSCGGGTITAAAGSNSVSLSGASLAASASCTFAVNVAAAAAGAQNNVTSAVTSMEGGNGSTASAQVTVVSASKQPPEPTNIAPVNGQVYYLTNQLSGLQADLNSNSTASGAQIVDQTRTFTDTSQRWAFTLPGGSSPGGSSSGGSWQISNILNNLCLDSATISGVVYVVQNPCAGNSTQQWTLNPIGDGYYTIANNNTGLLIDLYQGSTSPGATLDQTALSSAPTQSQQWLLRPAFFRGIDNALLEKQEAARASIGLPWWNDAGQPLDVLAMLKNHGINMVRLRPSSAPPYSNPSQTGCTGNACYAETDAQDLDLAKRAKNLGLSVELTLLFDGGSSASVPPAWASDTLAQLQTDIYAYVKSEIEMYRQAGVMPDLVAIGNEVDTGFLGSLGSPTGADFSGFASLQVQGLQAVDDAAADTSIGPAIPPPLTCIHITPAWNLSQFFALANQNGITYDAICQSYYPFFHGPLTDAQAAESNPMNQPVEQDVLVAAANSNSIDKPIFIIETGEHYENGFDANDPWYAPPSIAEQQQFLLDLEGVQEGLPNNLGMGIEYWDAAGVNIPNLNGGFINGDNQANAIYSWNGLTLFNNADSSGTTNVGDPSYSELLPGMDALGGNLDSTLSYKFVNRSSGNILSVYQSSNAAGTLLNAEADSGTPTLSQQWSISSNLDGYFQIASVNPGSGSATNVLDDSGASTTNGTAIVQSPANSSTEQEWSVVSVGNGYFNLVNRLSGLALDTSGGTGPLAGFVVQEPAIISAQTQQWQIVAVH